MTKKFTERQYQEIVKTQEVYFSNTLMNTGATGKTFGDNISGELSTFINFNDLESEAMALANPITRKWAKERFVEPEKKYYWRYKKKDNDGDSWYLKKSFGLIGLYLDDGYDESFTEKEIIEAGYNPDMFVKEEPMPF